MKSKQKSAPFVFRNPSCAATKDGSAVAETLLAPLSVLPTEDVLCERLTKPYALKGRARGGGGEKQVV